MVILWSFRAVARRLRFRGTRAAGFALLASSAALLWPNVVAQAAATTGAFIVSAKVNLACSVVSTENINFGAVLSPVVRAIQVYGSVTVYCSNGAGFNVALSKGNGDKATFARRKMTSGVNTLEYTLTEVNNKVWGDGTGDSYLYVQPCCEEGPPLKLHITAYLYAGQSPPAGDYSDIIVVTMTF